MIYKLMEAAEGAEEANRLSPSGTDNGRSRVRQRRAGPEEARKMTRETPGDRGGRSTTFDSD